MKRRTKASGKAGKAGRRKAATPKRSISPKAVPGRHSSPSGDDTKIARFIRERDEALEREKATAEVLRIISASPGELQPVFNSMLGNAVRLCEANFGVLFRFEDNAWRAAAMLGVPPAFARFWERGPQQPGPQTALGRIAETREIVHIADVKTEPAYVQGEPIFVAAVNLGGFRTLLNVPILKDGKLIGAVAIYRQEVRRFTDKQIALLTNFAAQAVIAIENTRLLNELRESLQQQTATADVLKVISRSTFDLQSVLDTLTVSAIKLCAADKGVIFLRDGDVYRFNANYGFTPEAVAFARANPIKPGRESSVGRVALTGKVSHMPDVLADPEYKRSDYREAFGYRTNLGVPMLREGATIGVFVLTRDEVAPFTDNQIELVTTFADQAVIAIENARLLNELRQSLEQQTATAEVLSVISASPGELQPVFQAMLENATRVCDAKFGTLIRFDGEYCHVAAQVGTPPEYAEYNRQRGPYKPTPGGLLDSVIRTKREHHTTDATADVVPAASARLGGARTRLVVPMLKEDKLIGAISIYRQEVRPFNDKQIELVKNFAAQTVIAIENTRLLNELRLRTDDLTESLEQQTATSEVLKVISSSPGALEPVFNAMLENATRICEAKVGNLFLFDGADFRAVAVHGESDYADWFRRDPMARVREQSGSPLDRLTRTKQVIHIEDLRQDESYIDGHDRMVSLVETAGARTHLVVPMLKDRDLVGAIVIYRQEVRPFTDKQIALVQNFAAQAVIAIENTRLLNELRESLQQQTATADVLKAISRSTFDLQTVLDTLVKAAAVLCDAERNILFRREGDTYKSIAYYNYSREFQHYHETHPIAPGRGTTVGRTALEGKTVQITDVLADKEYAFSDAQKLGQYRANLGVPLLREGKPIGALSLTRSEPRPFTEKQIGLVETFADQAVIAIENARLLSELRESLQQQTATADVLKVISRSTFNLQPVFDSMAESAVRLCEAERSYIFRFDGKVLQAVASFNAGPENQDWVYRNPIPLGRHSVSARAGLERRTVQVADIQADPEYHYVARDIDPIRTTLAVPMLKGDELIGTITIYRLEVKPFTENQISLMETFADQAVIAIENVRLFEAEQQRTRELAGSLDDLRTAQDRLVQTQKLASLGQLTAGIAHEIKNPLNFVNNFSGVSVELIDELEESLGRVTADKKTREEIAELADTLRDNLDKIVQHGKRADSIVKNMLLHSREGSGERRSFDINALVEESLNLAYHGARAETQGFNVTLKRSFDPKAGEIDAFPQEITRVLLNLISNGFYAATKRQGQEDGNGFEPTITAATKSLGERVEIRIRDNGTGISTEVREKMFNPFFTTKPAGEGTGLGLSISHDIIVKQHSGSIEVDTEPGAFTEFRIILPRTAA